MRVASFSARTLAIVESREAAQIAADHVTAPVAVSTTAACPGCMYGSYPEMSIAMRYLRAKFERLKLFLVANWKFSVIAGGLVSLLTLLYGGGAVFALVKFLLGLVRA